MLWWRSFGAELSRAAGPWALAGEVLEPNLAGSGISRVPVLVAPGGLGSVQGGNHPNADGRLDGQTDVVHPHVENCLSMRSNEDGP